MTTWFVVSSINTAYLYNSIGNIQYMGHSKINEIR